MKTFTEQLKREIRNSGMSRYAISFRTGVAQSTLSGFLQGKRGMSLESVNRLMETLGLEITKRKRG
jgi:transcriptional regulator with XRE-family HTH domain